MARAFLVGPVIIVQYGCVHTAQAVNSLFEGQDFDLEEFACTGGETGFLVSKLVA